MNRFSIAIRRGAISDGSRGFQSTVPIINYATRRRATISDKGGGQF